MASRKSNIPLGSASKSNPRIEVSKDGSLRHDITKGQAECNPDYERRKARVALRTGSPKPPARVSLRSAGTKISQTPPPVLKSPSRLSGSPSRLGTSSKASIRIKPSPERKPWGAPTIRVPPYHEQSISRRKKITAEPVVEETPPQPRLIRYTIEDLLALRPPPTARYAALSLSQEQATTGLADHYSTPLVAHFAVPAPQFNKLPTSYWEQQSAFFAQSTGHGITTTSRLEHEVSQTLHTEMQPLVSTPQSLHTEHEHSSGKTQLDEQAAVVQDLESRIRSALSHRGRRGSKSVRSVTWDPAVVPTSQTLDIENDTPTVAEKPIPSETPTEEIVKQIETPLETKPVDAPLASESYTTGKKQKKEFYQYMKSVTELKKGDRKKLLQLLEALKNLDSDDSSDTDIDTNTEARRVRRKNKNAERTELKATEPKSALDPTASAFQDRLPIHADATGNPDLRVQRQQVVAPTVDFDRDPNEPIWIRSIDMDFEGQERGHKKHNQENKPHSQADIFQSSPSHRRITTSKAPPGAHLHVASFPPAQNLFPQFVPYTISSAPLPPKISHNVSVAREGTKVNPKLPIIDLATGRIPDDDGPGREAQVVAWGNAILESFQQKYPMTGVQRAEPPAPIKSTHAATIQQRLEYLLMEQKEKQARGEGLAERSGNLQGSKLVKQIYQAEKDAMKRLKAEIRRDEAHRKLREPQLSESQLKMRMHMVPLVERISEDSTCVDSVHSGTHEEGIEEEDVTIILHHDD